MGFRCVSLVEGDLALELRIKTHRNASVYADEIANKIGRHIRLGRALVFAREATFRVPGLRVSALGAMTSTTKFRVVHGLPFSSGPSTAGVQKDTDFPSATTCELGRVLRNIVWRILHLRTGFGLRVRIVLRT